MLRSLDDLGFTETTPVQGETIVPMLERNDMLVQAPTGTGKTCAFGIPIIENIDSEASGIQAVVLCPTRELVLQTTDVFRTLTKFNANIKIAPIYGGGRIDRQLMSLRRKPQVVVATPGRMMDFLGRKALKLEEINVVVLDEADRMLDMGFRDELSSILGAMPENRQTVLFSATIPSEVEKIALSYQKEPVMIRVEAETEDIDQISQYYIQVKARTKMNVLIKLLDEKKFKLCLVFAGTKLMVDTIAEQLILSGHRAAPIHSGLRQSKRDYVMKQYRNGLLDILVATDVAARGLDVNNIDAVINYDIPQNAEDYIHRIGRTGRAHQSGEAFTFVYPKEHSRLRDIMHVTDTSILPVSIEVEPDALKPRDTSATAFGEKKKNPESRKASYKSFSKNPISKKSTSKKKDSKTRSKRSKGVFR